MPPPLLFAAAFLAGLAIQHRLTGAWLGPPGPLRAAGAVVIVLGLGVMLSGAATILRHRTTIIPHRRPSALVTRGPYRMTRNPMYVGITIVYAGLVLWTGAWAAAPLVVGPLVALELAIIPMEERHLSEQFGDAYREYCAGVRRWL